MGGHPGKFADTRIHGTNKRQVSRMFEEERGSLSQLPSEPFPLYHDGRCKVTVTAT